MAATALVNDTEKKDRERRVLFSYYHRLHRDLEAKRKAVGEEIKSVKLNAKASGFASAKLDHYLKSFMAEDQQKPVDKLKSELENLAWQGLIPDQKTKGDLFDIGDRVDKEQLLRAKGFHAGLNGLDRVSGYDAGGSEDKLWLESYDAGLKEFDTELPDIMARIEAAASKEEPPSGDGDPFSRAGDNELDNAAPTGKPN